MLGIVLGIMSFVVTIYMLYRNPLLALAGIMMLVGFVGPDFVGHEWKNVGGTIGVFGLFFFFAAAFGTMFENRERTGRFDLD